MIMDPRVYGALHIILFFIVTPFMYKALNSIDFQKIFKSNSTGSIRLILVTLSVIMAYLFVIALLSLFTSLYQII